MEQQDKQFFFKVFKGRFDGENGPDQRDMDIIVAQEDVKQIRALFMRAYEGEDVPGMSRHEKYGLQMRLRLRTSREGKLYVELNTYKPEAQQGAIEEAQVEPIDPPFLAAQADTGLQPAREWHDLTEGERGSVMKNLYGID